MMVGWKKRNMIMEGCKKMTVRDFLRESGLDYPCTENVIFGMRMTELIELKHFMDMFGPLMKTPTWQHLVTKMELEAAMAQRAKRVDGDALALSAIDTRIANLKARVDADEAEPRAAK